MEPSLAEPELCNIGSSDLLPLSSPKPIYGTIKWEEA
jgi:hypothetical protein